MRGRAMLPAAAPARLACLAAAAAAAAPAGPADRAAALLRRMSLADKLLLLAGHHSEDKSFGNYIGRVGTESGTPMRLGIPELKMNDAGQGFRDEDNTKPGSSTQWPSALSIAATWDVAAAAQWGRAMGAEFAGKGANVQLGPGLCVARIPQNGRNFEYMSGEDPHLGYVMVQPVVQGIQSMGVIATAKHWVNNNAEVNRTHNNAIVDERTRFEIYYPPFEGAVEAGVGSVMCGYNLINGEWSCQNKEVLADLKQRLGFKGWVMSDWGATHSAAINAGLDQEMPAARYFNPSSAPDALGTLIANGNVTAGAVNASVLRVLTPMFAAGIFDKPNDATTAANVSTPAHDALARQLAAQSMVLLKNDGLLPLRADVRRLLVVGAQAWARDAANHRTITGGQGSGSVKPPHVSAPLDSILARLGAAGNASCMAPGVSPRSPCSWNVGSPQRASRARGACGDPEYPEQDIMGHDLVEPPLKVGTAAECCGRCVAYDGCVAYTFYTGDGSCYCKSSTAGIRASGNHLSGLVALAPPSPPTPSPPTPPSPSPPPPPSERQVLYDSGTDAERAAATAATADVTLIFVACDSGEGHDRGSLRLNDIPYSSAGRWQPNASADHLIARIAERSAHVAVVMVSPGAVLTPWRGAVQAIVAAFLPGQEYGDAVTGLLWGDVEPTARLPLTFPASEGDLGLSVEQYPGVPKADARMKEGWRTDTTYSEKLLVGYRYYDARGVEPAFPFGHGLGYTQFHYSDLEAGATSVNFTLKNAGQRDGTETAQLYLGFPAGAGEPPKQLKGFRKVHLAAGASLRVSLPLGARAVSVWDERAHGWARPAGAFAAMVGASSRDIRLTAAFTPA